MSMKKSISILLVALILISGIPAFAAGSAISITTSKEAVNTGDIFTVTVEAENISAAMIFLPIHFNSAVVKVATTSGAAVASGIKTAAQVRSGQVGIIPGQALLDDAFDNSDNPLYWNGAIFENNDYYTSIDNNNGLIKLVLTNAFEKGIVKETLIQVRFVAIAPGNADIRFAVSSDASHDGTAPNGATYFQDGGSTAGNPPMLFDNESFPSVTVTGSAVNPPSDPGPGPGVSSPTSTVNAEPTEEKKDTLDYYVTEKLVRNLLARALDETNASLIIQIDTSADIKICNIYMPVALVREASNILIATTKFITPLGSIEFNNAEVLASAGENAQYVICTVTAQSKTTTIDGSPLKSEENTEVVVKDFADLPKSHWSYAYVMELVKSGVINGLSATQFAPDANITREQFARIIVLALGLHNENATCDFKDVVGGSWYESSVASAVNAGIIKGYEDNTFGVGKNITRQEMATIISRINTEFKEVVPKIDFKDSADISDWAKEAVAKVQMANIISGMPDQTFAPNANATRAQAAKVIYEFLAMINE